MKCKYVLFFLYFSSPLPPSAKKIRPLLEKAIRTWENRTCITFKEIPLEDEDDLHGYSDSQKRHRGPFLVFVRSSGCWSYVGRQYWRRWGQRLSIGRGCTKVGGWCLWVEETWREWSIIAVCFWCVETFFSLGCIHWSFAGSLLCIAKWVVLLLTTVIVLYC